MEVNREHDLGQCLEDCRHCCEVLMNEVNHDDQVLVKKFFSQLEVITVIAPKFDVLDVPANGLRSVLRTYLNILKKSSRESRTRQDVLNCVELIRNSVDGLDYIISNLELDQDRMAVTKSSREHLEQIQFLTDNKTLRNLFTKEYLHVDYEHSTTLVGCRSLFVCVMAACSAPSNLERFKSLVSYQSALENYMSYSTNANVLAKFFQCQEYTAFKFLYRIYSAIGHFRTKVTKMQVSTIREWEIIRNNWEIEIKNISKEPKMIDIRGSLLKTPDVNSSRNGKVLLFIHGQASLGPTDVEFAVNMCLREFSSQLPGLSIIAVEYPSGLGVAFPKGLQAVLDFYLWLVGGQDDVIKQLGFAPEEVVISGDSAGGNLAAALIVAVNEIRVKSMATTDDVTVRFPNAFVALYPYVNLSTSIGPSMLNKNFDFFLRPDILRSVEDNYCLGDPDYSKSSEKSLSRDDYEKLLRNPLISPVLYERMDDLKSISLTMIVINMCPLIDDSLELCSKWTGSKKLFALDGVCHPFLEFTDLDSYSRDATRFAIRQIDNVLS